MRERFISVKAEQRTGIPERRLPAFEFPSYVQPLARAVLSLPGGDKAPDEAIRDEADEILERVEALRRQGREKSQASVLALLLRHAGKIAVPAAFGTLAAAVKIGAESKTGKVLTDRVTLSDVARWETRPAQEDLPSYEDMRRELERAIGRERLEQEIPVYSPDYVRTVRERRAEREKHSERLSVSLEAKLGLPDLRVREIIRETTPRSWTGERAIEQLSIADERIPMPREYGIEGYADGICEHGVSHKASGIRLSPEFQTEPIRFSLLNHEFAHANDWRRSNTLPPEDRLTLFYLVHRRVESADRIHFNYVERIKNSDARELHSRRITEYWAELMSMAMDLPAGTADEWASRFVGESALRGAAAADENGKSLVPGEADLRIVNWYLSVTDPDFKPWEAKNRRVAMTDELVRESVNGRIKEELDRLPAGKIRASLTALVEREEQDDPAAVQDVRRFEDAQIEVALGVFSIDLSKPSQEYGYELLSARNEALYGLDRRVPDDLRAAMGAYRALADSISGWRKNRDRKLLAKLDLQNPRKHYYVTEMRMRVKNLQSDWHGLSPEEMREFERLAGEYLKIQNGEFEVRAARPASFERELANLKTQQPVSSL